jgi:hypothetical protein
MRVAKIDIEQRRSLLNLMCPSHDFDSWTWSQPRPEREEGNSSRNKGAVPTQHLQPSRLPNDNAHHPIETTHYAITVPVQSHCSPEVRRTST